MATLSPTDLALTNRPSSAATSPYNSLLLLFFLCAIPSLCFWTTATLLHLLGANRRYKGRVPVRSMLQTQLCIDFLQTFSSLPRFLLEPYSNHLLLRPARLLLGVLTVDCVEYSCHRLMHTVPVLRRLHKRHHALNPLHTFGAYYNSAGEALFTGPILGICMVGLAGLSVFEVSAVAGLASVCTVFDHAPGEFFGRKGVRESESHHEIHHDVCSECNFSQPFTPFLDWAFGTRYEDVLKRQMKEKETKEGREVKRVAQDAHSHVD